MSTSWSACRLRECPVGTLRGDMRRVPVAVRRRMLYSTYLRVHRALETRQHAEMPEPTDVLLLAQALEQACWRLAFQYTYTLTVHMLLQVPSRRFAAACDAWLQAMYAGPVAAFVEVLWHDVRHMLGVPHSQPLSTSATGMLAASPGQEQGEPVGAGAGAGAGAGSEDDTYATAPRAAAGMAHVAITDLIRAKLPAEVLARLDRDTARCTNPRCRKVRSAVTIVVETRRRMDESGVAVHKCMNPWCGRKWKA